MTDLDTAARVVAEKLLNWEQCFEHEGCTGWRVRTTDEHRDFRLLSNHTYEGMGAILEALRVRGHHPEIGLGDFAYCNIYESAVLPESGTMLSDFEPSIHWEADTLHKAVLLAAYEAVRDEWE